MKLFETSWRDGYTYYERVFDTQLNRSLVSEIKLPSEWYVESSKGKYSYILDNSIKLERYQGNAKDGRNQYGFIDPLYRNIKDNYWNKSGYNKNPRCMYIDIETMVTRNEFPAPENALEVVSLIQIYDSLTKSMIILGLRDWKHQKNYNYDFNASYIKCNGEYDLFDKYIKIFQRIDPLIIYGWNASGFDYPYLYNRMKNLGLDTNNMSNYGNCSLSESEFNGRKEFKFTAPGHHYVDLLTVYKNFTFGNQASYSLDATAEIVLGKNKVDHSIGYTKFQDFYDGNYIIPDNPPEWHKDTAIYKAALKYKESGLPEDLEEMKEVSHSEFVHYGIIDTHLVVEIDKAKNFTALQIMIAEKMGVLISDALGTVKPWSQYIYNKSLLTNEIMPKRQDNDDEIYVIGGFVANPVVGKHKWILSADVNSMYPLLGMVGFNMSPETFVPKRDLPADLREIVLRYYNDQDEDARLSLDENIKVTTTKLLNDYNYSMGINGAVFKKDKLGMVPEMVQDIYKDRKIAKQTQFKYEKRKLLIKSILDEKTA